MYFMLLFDLTTDRGASEGHMSHLDNGNISMELKFNKLITETITCIFYLEYHNSVRIGNSRNVSIGFKNGHDADILHDERRETFLGSLPLRPVTALCNANPHNHDQRRS